MVSTEPSPETSGSLFSKIISPGLRVGYMAGDPGILRKCTMGKQSTDVHTANLNQAIVDQFLRQNLLPAVTALPAMVR